MIDDTILDCTKKNREQSKNRFFLQGEPKAIMMFEPDAMEDTERQADALIKDLQDNNFGYALPLRC
jgi:polyribonucleotide nucleotidyltransferase